MNIIKLLGWVVILLFSTEGLAKKKKYRSKLKPYVGVQLGYANSFLYEEVRVGAKWKNMLFGVSYNKYPQHLWTFATNPEPSLESLGTIVSPTGEPLSLYGDAPVSAPSSPVAQPESSPFMDSPHSLGGFFKYSFHKFVFVQVGKVRVVPHVELAVQYRMTPNILDSSMKIHELSVDSYVGVNTRFFRRLATSVDVGLASVFPVQNPTNMEFAPLVKAELGWLF